MAIPLILGPLFRWFWEKTVEQGPESVIYVTSYEMSLTGENLVGLIYMSVNIFTNFVELYRNGMRLVANKFGGKYNIDIIQKEKSVWNLRKWHQL